MLTVGRPPIPERERRSETLRFRVQAHIYNAVKALAKREKVTMTKICERAVMAYIGLAQDAIDHWENEDAAAELLPVAPIVITPGAAATMLKNLGFSEDAYEDARGLKEDIDELKDIMLLVDKKVASHNTEAK